MMLLVVECLPYFSSTYSMSMCSILYIQVQSYYVHLLHHYVQSWSCQVRTPDNSRFLVIAPDVLWPGAFSPQMRITAIICNNSLIFGLPIHIFHQGPTSCESQQDCHDCLCVTVSLYIIVSSRVLLCLDGVAICQALDSFMQSQALEELQRVVRCVDRFHLFS